MPKEVLAELHCYCEENYAREITVWRKIRLFFQCMYYLTLGAVFHRDKYEMLMRIADSIEELRHRDAYMAAAASRRSE